MRHSRPTDYGHPLRSIGTRRTSWAETQEETREERHHQPRTPPAPRSGMGQGYGNIWARSGLLHHQSRDRTANRICDMDVSAEKADYSYQMIFSKGHPVGSNKNSKGDSYVCSSLRVRFGQPTDHGGTGIPCFQGATIHVNVDTASFTVCQGRFFGPHVK